MTLVIILSYMVIYVTYCHQLPFLSHLRGASNQIQPHFCLIPTKMPKKFLVALGVHLHPCIPCTPALPGYVYDSAITQQEWNRRNLALALTLNPNPHPTPTITCKHFTLFGGRSFRHVSFPRRKYGRTDSIHRRNEPFFCGKPMAEMIAPIFVNFTINLSD